MFMVHGFKTVYIRCLSGKNRRFSDLKLSGFHPVTGSSLGAQKLPQTLFEIQPALPGLLKCNLQGSNVIISTSWNHENSPPERLSSCQSLAKTSEGYGCGSLHPSTLRPICFGPSPYCGSLANSTHPSCLWPWKQVVLLSKRPLLSGNPNSQQISALRNAFLPIAMEGSSTVYWVPNAKRSTVASVGLCFLLLGSPTGSQKSLVQDALGVLSNARSSTTAGCSIVHVMSRKIKSLVGWENGNIW